MLQKMVKFKVLFAFQNMFSTILHPSVIHKINDQLAILLSLHEIERVQLHSMKKQNHVWDY